MSTITSVLAQRSAVSRRLALIGAALLAALAVLTAAAAVDAGAATLATPKSASGPFDHVYAVSFHNGYSKPVQVAIAKRNDDHCGHGRFGTGAADNPWEQHGWYNLNPGETKLLFTTANKYATYYADADDGTEWKGDYGPLYAYDHAFVACEASRGLTAEQLGRAYGQFGMRLITLPSYSWGTVRTNYTVNLT